MPFAAGDRVTVRGERWVVEEATTFAEATLVHLASLDCTTTRRCRLLAPFDRPAHAQQRRLIRAVTRRRWMHHLDAELSRARASGVLRAPQHAAIDILPFQLEPALAVVHGHASRVLLADGVGLGKTIQAGLILSELFLRGWCERALIVTPAGLRHQWADELLNRFDVRAAIIDASALSARTASLPFDVNPWSVEPVVITSIDFLKQPEVLHGLLSQPWDLLIVDEAHHAAIASLRHDAVNALATRARHVLLLTATPHAGDERAYRALCGIGKIDRDDPMVLFRRTGRLAATQRSRRVHLLRVTPAPAGMEMHRLLARYLAQLWALARAGNGDVQLVAMVLAKRAFSSARSLAASLEKRLAALDGRIDSPSQATLPLGFDDEPADDPLLPGARAFDSVDDERAVLRQLITAATMAQTGERKMDVLQRIVRRVREPLIIFTEYRDTLDAVAAAIATTRTIATLHGGLTPYERRQSVHAFTTGAADIMLATDAGSEGLNLHNSCRLVINLELPWNPIRLEQRIGRVDRIGQTRTVHAINLLSEGTAERLVLANLLRRIDRIRLSEIEIASCVINETEPPPRLVAMESLTDTVNLEKEARDETVRLSRARHERRGRSRVREDLVPVTILRSPEAALISFFRMRLVTAAGRLVEDSLVPVRIPIDHPQSRFSRRAARALAESLSERHGPDLRRCIRQHADERARAISLGFQQSLARAVRRERRIATCIDAASTQPVQAGLFDTKALKHRWAADRRRVRRIEESGARAELLEADSSVRLAEDPELVMLLIQCSRG